MKLRIGSGMILMAMTAAAAFAQSYPGRRDDYRGGMGGRENAYGYGYTNGRDWDRDRRPAPVERVEHDLRRLMGSPYLLPRERATVERALFELRDFQADLRRGRWDARALDRAIESSYCVARELRGPARHDLEADLRDLREFRRYNESQAYYGGPYGGRR